YFDCDVITRRAVLKNFDARPLVMKRMLSMSLDMPDEGFDLVTLDGGWIKEANRHSRPLQYGIYINSSVTGASSNKHNPGLMLARRGANEEYGEVYAFNLVYSGNHYTALELSSCDLVRVASGINPIGFVWELRQGECFETPEAVLSYSDSGFGKLSSRLHDFVNRHIVRGEWKNRERPVVVNDWEAYFFRFTRGKLLRLARRAAKLGVELFVLDDGWFGERDSDRAGLGDYNVNLKKLPGGLGKFAEKINALGMKFGLWFEPEMVNEDSGLFREHPEYAVTTEGKIPCLGRNQLVLDLCNPAVRDYIVGSVGGVLDSANIEYVKWDMNRRMSDACSPHIRGNGEFCHRYILGLYDVLSRIFGPRPKILFESCSSGGNRFDLGMLCFSPQIWASDDTDALERINIQGGLSLLYPLSCMGAHVSETPNAQTLRETPIATRFNVACFGCLGYELDFNNLTPVQMRETREQIEFYKVHRRTLQFGRFARADCNKDNKTVWQCIADDGSIALVGFFQSQARAAEGSDKLPMRGLEPDVRYTVETKHQRVFVSRFGALVKHLLPFAPRPDGLLLRLANRYYALRDCVERHEGSGQALMHGTQLNCQYIGTGYNGNIRMLGDGGSNIYVVARKDNNQKEGQLS
ncbi:MAG: alpha-galactosidase, partial [Oscillospiraceae bacterium]